MLQPSKPNVNIWSVCKHMHAMHLDPSAHVDQWKYGGYTCKNVRTQKLCVACRSGMQSKQRRA